MNRHRQQFIPYVTGSAPVSIVLHLRKSWGKRTKLLKKKECPSKKPQRNLKELILIALKEQPSLSIRELAVQCGMSIHSAQHHINKLKEAGMIRHVGSTKAGHWEVISDHVLKGDPVA